MDLSKAFNSVDHSQLKLFLNDFMKIGNNSDIYKQYKDINFI